MNQKSLKNLKKKLMDERERIVKGLNSLESDSLNRSQRDASGDLSGYAFHMADVATDNFDREFNLDLASNEQKILNDIDSALRKIDEGEYGICEGCSSKIKMSRLKVMPNAPRCIKCQQNEENENKGKF